ncbi:MAG: DUF2243 domain-containing protein [Leptolyngbyaceae cyanobacterium bins.349]|nr:DUF2243 domain-containing protein [Leptolyngbyaceae cyanobacterium bins.349]
MNANPAASSTIRQPLQDEITSLNYRPLIVAGLILGLGQGGFFDGIVFHQLLQWHHMFSSLATDQTIAGMELNTIGDGLFHLFDWSLTLLGIFLLWRAGRLAAAAWSGRVLGGAILLGAGIFNLVEGLIDHQILGIHHLKPGPHEFGWDMGFLASGLVLIGIGWLLTRTPAKAV